MKIFIDGVNFDSRTGPNSFGKRLAIALYEKGHTIADPHDYDVHLAFIEPTRQTLPGKPLVQRLDGIWFKPEQFASANAGIKACHDRASGVIWQSEFDRNMTSRWWGSRPGTVIRNGIGKHEIQDAMSRSWAAMTLQRDIVRHHEHVFVASANWHPQKRLQSNIAAFKHLQKFHPDSCLIIMGANAPMIADPKIFYAGSVEPDVYFPVFKAATWMLHLAWLDHCPNTIVEALAQDTPIICTDSGGTHELVGSNGIVIKETVPYNYELTDYDSPPDVDVTQLGPLPKITVNAPELDIAAVADRYVTYMETLL